MSKGILWALVLDRKALDQAVPARFGRHEAHHLTLRFGVDLAPYAALLGRRFQAAATAEAWDDEVQAIRVALPAELAALCDNAHPHVTISRRPDTPAKRANQMLEAPPNERPLSFELALEIGCERWGRRR